MAVFLAFVKINPNAESAMSAHRIFGMFLVVVSALVSGLWLFGNLTNWIPLLRNPWAGATVGGLLVAMLLLGVVMVASKASNDTDH